jgi:hypothetical protein
MQQQPTTTRINFIFYFYLTVFHLSYFLFFNKIIFYFVILIFLKELKESFNYGLFYPPSNGRAGKFLDEERPLSDYPFNGPGGYLEVT